MECAHAVAMLQELLQRVQNLQFPPELQMAVEKQLKLFKVFLLSFGPGFNIVTGGNDLLQIFGHLSTLLQAFDLELHRLFNQQTPRRTRAKRTLDADVNVASIYEFINKLFHIRISLQRFVADDISFAVRRQRIVALRGIFQGQDTTYAKVGSGSFGLTYQMENSPLGCVFAVKRIDLTRALPEQFTNAKALNQECDLLQALKHPNIARYFTNFYSDLDRSSRLPRCFNIVMELIEGGSLASKITTSPHRPSEVEIVDWARQMASALCHMHNQRVYHRDLKPNNVMLTGRSTIKIIDLGLASRNTSSASLRGTLVGSAPYASFEKTTGVRYDSRDDIWAMGLIFLELLKGQL
jgi:hypothetical protein